MKSETKETRIPVEDWGRFCWQCHHCGFSNITGRMTDDGELIVVSGVPQILAEELARNLRCGNELVRFEQREMVLPNDVEVIADEGASGGPFGEAVREYYASWGIQDVEVIESEKEHRTPRIGPTLTGGEHGDMPDGDCLDANEYYSRARFKGVRAKREVKKAELVSEDDVEVIESEKEHGGGATDES